jgi:hypothetical protein
MQSGAYIPRLVKPLVPLISWMTARYIAYHRKRLVRGSATIHGDTQAKLRGFFPDIVLAETRIIRAVMPEPILYPLVKTLGIRGVLEMSSIGAITLVDVVAYRERLDRSTLFHELVHVVQYRVLGLKRFAELYVKGFLSGGGYEGTPLELQAYELGARFDREPKKIFSVEEDVIRRNEAGLL